MISVIINFFLNVSEEVELNLEHLYNTVLHTRWFDFKL
jgi:hypothetical protein